MVRHLIPYLLLTIGIVFGVILAWRTKTINHDGVVLKAFACTCPDYRVVQGSWKIKSPLLDTIAYLDKSEVYVTGMKNP